jgi:hypothetical protein
MNFGEEFREEVLASPGQTVFRTVGGWRFGLSHGEARMPTRLEYDWIKSGRGSQFANTHSRPNLPPTYEEFVERFEYQQEALKAFGITDETWCLSASLWPRGRPSRDKDWKYLGEMCAALGAPKDSLKTPFSTTHPNDVHYWIWEEKKSEAS